MRIIIVGPPKTGNAWLKCLLSNTYNLKVIKRPPRSTQELSVAIQKSAFEENILFHQHLFPSPDLLRVAASASLQFVTVLRDPYDAFVSLYFFAQNFQKRYGTHRKLNKIVNKPIDHPDVLDFLRRKDRGYGANLKLAEAWLNSGQSLIIRYEELRQDAFSALKRLTSQIEPVSDDELHQAIKACSVDNMRKMKKRSSKHIRKGTVGDYQNYLTEDHLTIFREQYATIIGQLGYHVV